MQNDEQAIRDLVETWLAASHAADLATLLNLMADDVIFMVPGKEPFGKEAFAAMSQEIQNVQVEGKSNIQEIKVLGDWAWMRNFLTVTITPPNGSSTIQSGYILTILRKNAGGSWVIARDANLLTPKTSD